MKNICRPQEAFHFSMALPGGPCLVYVYFFLAVQIHWNRTIGAPWSSGHLIQLPLRKNKNSSGSCRLILHCNFRLCSALSKKKVTYVFKPCLYSIRLIYYINNINKLKERLNANNFGSQQRELQVNRF